MKNEYWEDTAGQPTVSYNIGRLDRLVNQQLSEALKPLGVSLPQFTMLSNLQRRGATANAALAARSFISPQAANQIVNTMVQHNWVTKRNDPNHGRMVLIELTDTGREVFARCMKEAEAFEAKMLHGLTPESVIMLKATVQRLLDNLRGG
ncbi:MarR family winged helix-turn-helix transcriptional regulator [Neisseria weixii]|uniref:MarR family transcriptional regulator n=1 Tax=Neisseria weixii TaxID=1853276 RepID=A0A3N4N2L9_9NEIS|nr:MarR family transcriptional regulator [Neisseria weixii]ATD65675.1 MarR family transcriptional regulator [Neisseria weixii]RPD85629.1 MarR family transcriptional regulator [Neisseria weixii]RPD86182.1 MarR family transcriptional regulator [Neisseria weixii]